MKIIKAINTLGFWLVIVGCLAFWNLIATIIMNQDKNYKLEKLIAENKKEIEDLYGWWSEGEKRQAFEAVEATIEFEKLKNHKHRYYDGKVIP